MSRRMAHCVPHDSVRECVNKVSFILVSNHCKVAVVHIVSS